MDIYSSYNILLGRHWIHVVGTITSFLHQCLKYIVNGALVTVRAEETLAMIQNVVVPYMEVEGSKYGNLHAFEIVNKDWVLENSVLRKPAIFEAARMAARYFLKHKLPFQYNPITGSPERISLIR
jgi:hypothetical protein